MGTLTERVQTLAAEQSLSRQSYEALPDRIILLLSPRLSALEATDKSHEARLVALERNGWKLIGGGLVLLAGLGLVVGHPVH